MHFNQRTAISLGTLVLIIAGLLVVGLAFPALAAPPAQNTLPTPTLFPVDNPAYVFETVGGSADPITFTHETFDGFTLTETVAQTYYPAGMEFTIGATSQAGAIESVSWTLVREKQFFTRAVATYDATRDKWVAHPWEGGGQPAWTEGTFFWRIKDSNGTIIETEPQFVAYVDPEEQWYRVESEHMVLYWSGIHNDNPEAFARQAVEFIEGVYPRWVAGFGRGHSYKPMAIVYPNANAYAHRFLSGVVPANLGVTGGGEGFTTQRLRPEGNSSCQWWPRGYWTYEHRVEDLLGTIAHEFTHLLQQDLGRIRGPLWWFEGSAEWFGNSAPFYFDVRMHALSGLQDMPTLQDAVGYRTREADGCTRLAYDAGASFVNWFMINYGGIETYQAVIQLQYQNMTLYDSIEQVTGLPFLEIENAWRAAYGFAALAPQDLDPALLLQAYEDSLFDVGDAVVMPTVPAMAMIYAEPSPIAAVSGTCWANMEATILEMGQLDGVAYFKVDCMGQVGWMTRDQLAATE